MIVLDTNVVSEMMRPRPDERVAQWLAARPRSAFRLTSLTEAEILFGLELLPDAGRKAALAEKFANLIEIGFGHEVLAFDAAAAAFYAAIAARRRRIGRPISAFDAQIAAISASRGAALATRNVTDFEYCDIEIVNPWTDE